MVSMLSGLLGCIPIASNADNEPQPNIVLIGLDGMRADRTYLGGGEHRSSPNLDELAAEGAIFDNTFSQSNESLFSHASMFTSRIPSEIGFPDYLSYAIGEKEMVLAEALKAVGYQTSAFVSGGHVKEVYGFAQGFDTFKEGRDFGSFFDTVPMAVKWLDGRTESDKRQPFFMFLHGYDCHRPYGKDSLLFHPFGDTHHEFIDDKIYRRNFSERIFNGVFYSAFRHPRVYHTNGERILDPKSYRSMEVVAQEQVANGEGTAMELNAEQLKHIGDHYDASVLSADTYVGLFIQHLKDTGQWENTIVIATADHGEDLGEHALFNHRSSLYDTTTKVPMVIGGGALEKQWRGTAHPDLSDALDLVPTILDYAGTVTIAGSKGKSLRAVLESKSDMSPSTETTPTGNRYFEVTSDEDLRSPWSYQEGVLGHTALRTPQWRLLFGGFDLTDDDYIRQMESQSLYSGYFELYHSSEDPYEQDNLVETESELASEMRNQMVRIAKGLRKGQTQIEVPAELKKILQEKGGYF
jgi:arylsulfatase